MKKDISVIIPIFNEQSVVKDTIERIKKTVPSSEIIAINDGSSDDTFNILNSIDGITIINHPYNLGYGASLKDGIKIANGQWIVITDADGTYPIEDIPKLVKPSLTEKSYVLTFLRCMKQNINPKIGRSNRK